MTRVAHAHDRSGPAVMLGECLIHGRHSFVFNEPTAGLG
jgi:hypothetical protein